MQKSIHRFRIAKPSIINETAPGAAKNPDPDVGVTNEDESSSGGHDKGSDLKAARPNSACERCRRLKRKCSRTLPQCSLCIAAGSICSLSNAKIVSYAQVKHLIDQVEHLSKRVNGQEEDTVGGLKNIPASYRSAVVGNDSLQNQVVEVVSTEESGVSPDNVLDPALPQHVAQQIPSEATGRNFVDAYFRHIHRAYPFMDRTKVLQDIENMGDSVESLQSIPTKLYMVMAIGCTTLRRAGQVSNDLAAKYKISHHAILSECLSRRDIDSIETLLLLGLQSLFDPSGLSPWVITGALARQVMTMGLSRKTSATQENSMTLHEVEMRHRLYWSIYTLDRMVSVTTGLPFGMNDSNNNVPLPGVTLEEYATTERQYFTLTLQINRHIIALRQLEEQILSTIHLSNHSTTSGLTQSDRQVIFQDLRTQIENWYTQGCLVTPMERDQIPFHNTIPWLNLRYQNLLLLLYMPSHFNSSMTLDRLYELQRATQKYIQFNSVLFQQRHLPLNWITLSRFVSLCPVILYCLLRSHHGKYIAREELTVCIEILEAFDESWVDAGRTVGIYRQLREQAVFEITDKIKQEMGQLIGDVLGASSIYATILEATDEIERDRVSDAVMEHSVYFAWPDLPRHADEMNHGLWADLDDMSMVLV